MTLLDLDPPASWPSALREHLDGSYPIFLGWEQRNGSVGAAAYDAAHNALWEALQPYSLRGWHCTRLTDAEIAAIEQTGMHLPNEGTLSDRIEALVTAGTISADIADLLKDDNESGEPSRAGMLHFMFCPPHHAGEWGIGRFFAHWGGEALYNSHEDNPVTSTVLSRIGTPCVIEAEIPISHLKPNGGTSDNIVHRYLISRGFNTSEAIQHEDRIIFPLPAKNVLAVHRHPGPEFLSLTRCSDWASHAFRS